MPQRPADDLRWKDRLVEQFNRNKRLFYRLAFGVLRNNADADDVCQHAMLKAWEFRHALREDASVRNWLARTILHRSYELLRQRSVEESALAFQARRSAEPDETTGGAEQVEAVRRALEKLPDELQIVVALRHLEEGSGNEVAYFLGTSAADVSRKLRLGIEMLERLLADWKQP